MSVHWGTIATVAVAGIAAFGSLSARRSSRRAHAVSSYNKDQLTPRNGKTIAQTVEDLSDAFLVHSQDGHGADARSWARSPSARRYVTSRQQRRTRIPKRRPQ